MITDDPIRDLEAELVAAAARTDGGGSRAPIRTRVWSPRRRLAGGALVAVLVLAAILAGMPFGAVESHHGVDGVAILRTAAAAASTQPARLSNYRYTSVIEREAYTVRRGGQHASVILEQPAEQWVDREGKGHQALQPSRVVARTGDESLMSVLPRGLQAPGDEPYPSTDTGRRTPPVDQLPSDPAALLDALATAYREGRISPDSSRPSPDREGYEITTVILQLLSDANTSPDQRAALFEALARMGGVKGLGTITDPVGRSGQGVAIDTNAADPLPSARFTVIIDARTSALLSWTITSPVSADDEPALTSRTHIVVRQLEVDNANARR